MTTIAAFATFKHPNNKPNEKSLGSIYILSDSKWTWIKNNSIAYTQANGQKIFYNRDAKVAFAYSGDAECGYKICSTLTNLIATDPSVRFAESIEEKKSQILNGLNNLLGNIPKQERKATIELFSVMHCIDSLYAFTFKATPNESIFKCDPVEIENKTHQFASGSGADGFVKTFEENLNKNPNVEESAVYFNSFIKFLKKKLDKFSELPCQGVVINSDGNIKPISIKHEDSFYKLGNVDAERANLKLEVDYRDEEFEFLHADGRIKGKDQKHYHFAKE